MKKSNLFSFFARGATATHPLCSVFIITILFIFCTFSVSVRASSSPSNLPLSDEWQFGQALEAYKSLNLDQQKISDFLVGCQGNAYAGLSNYNLQSSYSDFDSTVSGFSNFGNKIWNGIKDAYNKGYEIGSGIRNKLSNFLGSTVEYASSISMSFDAWLGNIGIHAGSSAEFRIGYYPETTKDYINYLGDESLYQWQKSSLILTPADFTFIYNVGSMPGSYNDEYYHYLNSMPLPHVRANWITNTSYQNVMYSSDLFSTYKYLFADLTYNSCYLCDSSGNPAPSVINAQYLYYYDNGLVSLSPVNLYILTIPLGNYSSLLSLFYDLDYNASTLIRSHNANSTVIDIDLSFIEELYVGESWNSKSHWTSDFDLNFAPVSNYVTVYSPNQPIYLDIVGFINDLYDNDKTIKKSVEDNSVISTGTPLPADIWDTVSNYFTRPESGIHIGTDFFKLPGSEFSIFDTYIADLWRNTKDFVLFCGDILNVFTLDGGGGLAYVVYGGIAVGVIGGIFSKFLL